jgi:hypothetical protein
MQLTGPNILQVFLWQVTKSFASGPILFIANEMLPCKFSSQLSHVVFMRFRIVADRPVYFMFVRLSIRIHQHGICGRVLGVNFD